MGTWIDDIKKGEKWGWGLITNWGYCHEEGERLLSLLDAELITGILRIGNTGIFCGLCNSRRDENGMGWDGMKGVLLAARS